jgi:hypothetical protein
LKVASGFVEQLMDVGCAKSGANCFPAAPMGSVERPTRLREAFKHFAGFAQQLSICSWMSVYASDTLANVVFSRGRLQSNSVPAASDL